MNKYKKYANKSAINFMNSFFKNFKADHIGKDYNIR